MLVSTPSPGTPVLTTTLRAMVLSVGLLGAVASLAVPASAAPDAGKAAPGFTLNGVEGKVYTLDELKGKQGVVLAWFPKPFTPG